MVDFCMNYEEHEGFGVGTREQERQRYESVWGQSAWSYGLVIDIWEKCKHLLTVDQHADRYDLTEYA